MAAQPTNINISSADLQAAIVALIQQNNAELRQLIAEVLPPLLPSQKKPRKTTQKTSIITPLSQKTYQELPFWKANPHLQPAKITGYGLEKEVFEKAQLFFQQPNHRITEMWLEDLD